MRSASHAITTRPAASLGSVPLRTGRPGRRNALARDPNRQFAQHSLVRRDARRFGQALARTVDQPAPAPAPRASSDLRLFAHTFGAAFLFVTVFLA